jgi:hypothetical protein
VADLADQRRFRPRPAAQRRRDLGRRRYRHRPLAEQRGDAGNIGRANEVPLAFA